MGSRPHPSILPDVAIAVAAGLTILMLISMLHGCVRRTEVRSASETNTALETETRAEASAEGAVRERDTVQKGPSSTETVTVTEQFAPDGGLALRRTRRIRAVAGPVEETKDVQSDEHEQVAETRQAEEVKHETAKTDSVETVKPASCLGLRLGVALGLMVAVAALLLWRRLKSLPL